MDATADLMTGIAAASQTDEAARFDSLPPFLQAFQSGWQLSQTQWTDEAATSRDALTAGLISGQAV
jgi:hypothetical protein